MSDESAEQGGKMSSVEKTRSVSEVVPTPGPGEKHFKKFQVGAQIEQPTLQTEVPDIRMELDLTGGTEDKPASKVEQERREQELNIAERLLRQDYRSSMTIIGEDLIQEMKQSVEVGDFERLKYTISKSIPLAEGLEFGIYAESYGVSLEQTGPPDPEAQRKENNVYSKLRNMFLTVEDSIDRGNIGYLRDAMLDSLSRPIRELEDWDVDKGATWERKLRSELSDNLERENLGRVLNGKKPISEDDVHERIEIAVEFRKKRQKEKIENIRENRGELLALDLHVKARFTIDNAFRQRQYVAHDRGLQTNMKETIGLGAAEPDGTHWHGFYQVDEKWGRAVDKVERDLVELGKDGFFRSNLTTKDFKNHFIKRLLDASPVEGSPQRRMDVVWAAWRQFCFKELVGKYHMGSRWVDEKNKNAGHKITFEANPPYVGDFSSWTSHPDEHRAGEFGWNFETFYQARDNPNWDGKLVGQRAKKHKSVSHSGHPISIGHLTTKPQPTDRDRHPIARFGKWAVGNYMEFATLDKQEDIPKKQRTEHAGRSLWEVWQGYIDNNKKWVEGISMADPDFPWVDTDIGGAKSTSDEAPSSSVGYWFLQRGRAFGVLKEMLGAPDLREYGSLASVTKYRNWEKLGMVEPGKFMKNPVYVKALADTAFYNGLDVSSLNRASSNKAPFGELEMSSVSIREALGPGEIGMKNDVPSIREHALHLFQEGLIDYREYESLRSIKRNYRVKG